MEQRIYHGTIQPQDFARDLIAYFHRGNYRVQQVGSGDRLAIQIATGNRPASGGQTALSINIDRVDDGVLIKIGEQSWLGVAASLGMSAFTALRNPLGLLNRLDDIAQDIESLQLSEQVWRVIENTAKTKQAGVDLSERLKRIECPYCSTGNPVGQPRCLACGAPLGGDQPETCKSCGYVLKPNDRFCPNCGKSV